MSCFATRQAFAWFSDLLVEHSEIFWSLFAVDMDSVLAEQPPDSWNSFPLFQILNDYLRTDGKHFRRLSRKWPKESAEKKILKLKYLSLNETTIILLLLLLLF